MTTELEAVSNEKLAELLAGLEGVTPGPWKVEGTIYKHMSGAIRAIPDDKPIAQLWKSGSVALDAEHIARCDPDTIRAIVTELQARRANVSEAEKASECLWTDKPCTCGGAACTQVDFGGDD